MWAVSENGCNPSPSLLLPMLLTGLVFARSSDPSKNCKQRQFLPQINASLPEESRQRNMIVIPTWKLKHGIRFA